MCDQNNLNDQSVTNLKLKTNKKNIIKQKKTIRYKIKECVLRLEGLTQLANVEIARSDVVTRGSNPGSHIFL